LQHRKVSGPALQKNGLTIQNAKLTDAPALAALMCELGYETTSAEMRRRLKPILRDGRYRTFLAEVDGKVCGMIGTLAYHSFAHNEPGGRIVTLVVRRDSRRLGVGRSLVAAVEKDFVGRAIKRVGLDTRLTREDAHHFYESLGYKRNGWRFVKELSMSD
jgi:ribosomal protein S18 acetylase RimI-like enzyme